MAQGRTGRWVLLALLLGLSVRVAHLSAVAASTIPHWQEVNPEADFGATWRWAAQIRAGDWLGRVPYHPYTTWMARLGSRDTWAHWWGGVEIFQQAPLYPYVVALVAAPPAGSPVRVFALQVLLGALCVPLVFALTRRWGSTAAGLVAAFLWALAQPEVALDALLLRDSMTLPFLLLGFYCLDRLRDARSWPGAYAPWAAGAGLSLGLATLNRESVLPFACVALLLAAWLVARGGPERRPWACGGAASAAALAGLALVLAPLVVRNVRVGAPPLALANRGPEAVLTGFSPAPGTDPIFFTIYPGLPQDLERAHGSTLRALRVCLEEARAVPGRFARNLAKKVWGWLSSTDPGDNVDLAYLCLRSPVLSLCLPMVLLLGFAFLGLIPAFEQPRRLMVLWAALVCLAGPLVLTSVLWRIRATLLPMVVPLAALGLTWAVQALRGQRRQAGLLALVAVAVYILLATRYRLDGAYRFRPLEAWMAADVHLRKHRPAEALEDLDEYLALTQRGLAVPSHAVLARRGQIQVLLVHGANESH